MAQQPSTQRPSSIGAYSLADLDPDLQGQYSIAEIDHDRAPSRDRRVPPIGEDVTALMLTPPIGADVTALMNGSAKRSSFAQDLAALKAEQAPRGSFAADLAALKAGVPHYLSTDPNAGTDVPAAAKYLSTDPNAGADAPAQRADGKPARLPDTRRLLDKIFTPLPALKKLVETLAPLTANASHLTPFPAQLNPAITRMIMPTSAGDIALMAGGPVSKAASGALALRGIAQMAKGDGVAEKGQGAIETLLGVLGARAGVRPRGAPPASAARTGAVPPATTAAVDDVIARLRAATRPTPPAPVRGFAEPPIGVRTPGIATPPALPASVVEAVAARPGATPKPHVTAAEVVEYLKQLNAAKATRPATSAAAGVTAPVPRASKIATDVLDRGTVPTAPNVSDLRVRELLEKFGGRGPGAPVNAPLGALPSSAASDAALLRGRTAFENTIPRGTPIPDEVITDLNLKGLAYRDADRAFLDATRDFSAGKIDSPALQTIKLARRHAGKDLRRSEIQHRETLNAINKPLPKDAGVIAPDVLRWMASTSAGATVGASADDEHPLRGALVGGLLGAAVPGTAAGVRSEGGRAVVKAYVSGLLSGPPTHVRNATSNTLNGLFRYVSHPAAVVADVIRTDITGAPREKFLDDIVPGVVATVTGVRRGVADALKVIRTGQGPYAAVQGPRGLPQYELPGGLTNVVNWPGRALLAMDTLFGRTIESQALAELAYATARKRGLTGISAWRAAGRLQASPTPELLAAAHREANRVIFRDNLGEGWTKRFVDSVEHVREQHPVIGGVLVPFIRVPATIFRQMVELTPAGLALKDTLSVRERMERFGRMFTGSLIVYQGANLLWEGRASGAGPANPHDRARLMESGWRPYSLNVPLSDTFGQKFGGSKSDDGTYWIANNALGPVGLLFSATADLVEGWKESGERDDATREQQIFAALGRLAHVATDQTFLSDASELAEALNNPHLAQRYFNRKAQSAVPMSSLLRTITRAGDTTLRQPETLAEALKEIIPGQSESVPSRLDRFGEDISRPTPPGAAAYILPPISPARRSELLELLDRTGAKVGKPTGRMSIGDFTPPLSREEERDLVRQRGQLNKRALQLLHRSDSFNAYPPEAQKILIERLQNRLVERRRTGEIIDLIKKHPAWGPEIVQQLRRQQN